MATFYNRRTRRQNRLSEHMKRFRDTKCNYKAGNFVIYLSYCSSKLGLQSKTRHCRLRTRIRSRGRIRSKKHQCLTSGYSFLRSVSYGESRMSSWHYRHDKHSLSGKLLQRSCNNFHDVQSLSLVQSVAGQGKSSLVQEWPTEE